MHLPIIEYLASLMQFNGYWSNWKRVRCNVKSVSVGSTKLRIKSMHIVRFLANHYVTIRY